jgi:glycosyltransferase involved in cell wall biosynthesis
VPKLIFVNRYFHPDHSATSQLLSDLAFHLADRGWDVSVLTSGQRYDAPGDTLPTSETVRGVSITRLPGTRFGRGNLIGRALDYATFHLALFRRLRRMMDEETIVVALTDPPLLSWTVAMAIRRNRALLVNWIQDVFPEVAEEIGVLRKGGASANLLRKLRDASARRAALNVAVGDELAERIGLVASNVRTIHNWADGEAIEPIEPGSGPLRAEWGLADSFVVAYSGNFGRVHEFDTLLGAMRIIAQGDLRPGRVIRFLFIGGGPRLASFRDAVEIAGIPGVTFLPYQPREALKESLGAADAHLITMRDGMEGLVVPSKFYGIAAAGRPAIYVGSLEGDVARLIIEHGCGVVIPSGDSARLAQVIHDLANDPQQSRRFGSAARAAFERNWSGDVALKRWEDALKRISDRSK